MIMMLMLYRSEQASIKIIVYKLMGRTRNDHTHQTQYAWIKAFF